MGVVNYMRAMHAIRIHHVEMDSTHQPARISGDVPIMEALTALSTRVHTNTFTTIHIDATSSYPRVHSIPLWHHKANI
jgi:hypothetical protein